MAFVCAGTQPFVNLFDAQVAIHGASVALDLLPHVIHKLTTVLGTLQVYNAAVQTSCSTAGSCAPSGLDFTHNPLLRPTAPCSAGGSPYVLPKSDPTPQLQDPCPPKLDTQDGRESDESETPSDTSRVIPTDLDWICPTRSAIKGKLAHDWTPSLRPISSPSIGNPRSQMTMMTQSYDFGPACTPNCSPPCVATLVEKVKATQRSYLRSSISWHSFLRERGVARFDPALQPACLLEEFLELYENATAPYGIQTGENCVDPPLAQTMSNIVDAAVPVDGHDATDSLFTPRHSDLGDDDAAVNDDAAVVSASDSIKPAHFLDPLPAVPPFPFGSTESADDIPTKQTFIESEKEAVSLRPEREEIFSPSGCAEKQNEAASLRRGYRDKLNQGLVGTIPAIEHIVKRSLKLGNVSDEMLREVIRLKVRHARAVQLDVQSEIKECEEIQAELKCLLARIPIPVQILEQTKKIEQLNDDALYDQLVGVSCRSTSQQSQQANSACVTEFNQSLL